MTATTVSVTNLRRRIAGFRIRLAIRRYRILAAWRFLRGTMTANDGFTFMDKAFDATGIYPLYWADARELEDEAFRLWHDNPALPALCRRAAAHIHRTRWDWALQVVEEHAKADGIVLVERDFEEE